MWERGEKGLSKQKTKCVHSRRICDLQALSLVPEFLMAQIPFGRGVFWWVWVGHFLPFTLKAQSVFALRLELT